MNQPYRSSRPDLSRRNDDPSGLGVTLGGAPGLYFGVVTGNTDQYKFGRVTVFIPRLHQDPATDYSSVRFMSPFGGIQYSSDKLSNTPGAALQARNDRADKGADAKKYGSGEEVYGMWNQTPSIGSEVLVQFINGDLAQGVIIGVLFPDYRTHGIPGLAASNTHQEPGKPLPAVEYNNLDQTSNPDDPIRLAEPTRAAGLSTQGLLNDFLRGQTTSSARREAPSKVFGIQTQGKSEFIMDDDPNHQFIRLRTHSGAQILIDETYGLIYLVSRDGKNWVEMNNNGRIDVYAKNDINIHTEANLNIKADKDVNIDATGNLNIKCQDMHLQTVGDMHEKAGGLRRSTVGSEWHRQVGGPILENAGGDIGMDAPNIHLNSGVGSGAAAATPPRMHSHPENRFVKESVTTKVPEHEPWFGHPDKHKPPQISGTEIKPQAAPPIKERDGKLNPDDPEDKDGECSDPAPIGGYSLSDDGKNFIVKNLKYWPYAHKVGEGDFGQAGQYVIGYTTTGTLEELTSKYPLGIKESEAWQLFENDLQSRAERIVKSSVSDAQVTQQQYDALVSLAFWANSIDGVADKVPGDKKVAADAINGYTVGPAEVRSAESNLYLNCEYGDGSRCKVYTDGMTNAAQQYGNDSSTIGQRKQVAGSFWKMGINAYDNKDPWNAKFVKPLEFEQEVKTELGQDNQGIVDPCGRISGSVSGDYDWEILSKTLFGEAEPNEQGMRAVASVVINRHKSRMLGGPAMFAPGVGGVAEVCLAGSGAQFNCWSQRDRNLAKINRPMSEMDATYKSGTWPMAKAIARQYLDGAADITGGATFYAVKTLPSISWLTKIGNSRSAADWQGKWSGARMTLEHPAHMYWCDVDSGSHYSTQVAKYDQTYGGVLYKGAKTSQIADAQRKASYSYVV